MDHDHHRLGRELGLFATEPLVGAGLPLWLPDGAVIRAEIERLAAEQAARGGCQRVYTPVLAKRELYERSGHWEKFSDDMFPAMRVGGDEFVLRPANCPHHVLVYAAEQRSFRDLPIRLAELGAMFRSELSGVLGGLSRVRQINLDDVHVFCKEDQIADEVAGALTQIRHAYDVLGIEIAYFRLSRRGEGGKYLGAREVWNRAEAALAGVLRDLGLDFVAVPGEAAFYGPKIDIQINDAAGREESLSTVQLDFNLPERFELEYIGSDGMPHRPVMIHRGALSAMERIVAYLIERYDGAFPPWLAPVQAIVLPVAERHVPAALEVRDRLAATGIRAEADASGGTLAARIRRAQRRRVPYQAVVGDREVMSGTVSLRLRDGRQFADVPVGDLTHSIAEAVSNRCRDVVEPSCM